MLGAVQTERLDLVPWSRGDTEALVELDRDPAVMRYIGDGTPLDRAASEALSERIAGHWAQFGFGLWAVRPRSGARAARTVGFAGLQHARWLPGDEGAVEVGWRLAREAWGHGYATEAARAALGVAFGALALTEVISCIQPGNVRSERVAARLGMYLERAAVRPGTYDDLLIWALRADRPRRAGA